MDAVTRFTIREHGAALGAIEIEKHEMAAGPGHRQHPRDSAGILDDIVSG